MIGVALVAVALCLAAAGVALWRVLSARVPWQPLPGTTCWYVAPASVPPEVLRAALLRATGLLETRAGLRCEWTGLRIFVVDGSAWVDEYGRHIAGETTSPDALYVLRDLRALCHELAHVAELRATGTTDATHATWATNGVQRAIDAYEAGFSGP